MPFRLIIIVRVDLIRDQARHRCDERSQSAQIHADRKILQIVRKIRQKQGRRNIADDLARPDADRQFPARHKTLQDRPYRLDIPHIADEDEETDKRKQQTVIHLQKHRTIRKNEYNEHHGEHQLPRKHPRYRKQA